jgi:16S rRNA (cytidine1402-2'-O)-methyltransferase
LEIHRDVEAFHEHSGPDLLRRIETLLNAGNTLTYVTDAGMPGISDPGFELVRLAHRLDVTVDVLPGPCAAVNALVLSGLPNHEFCFLGFFPEKHNKRHDMLDRLAALQMTAIFYESPKRIGHCLDFLAEHAGQTPIAVCRELTKQFQQTLRGTPAEVAASLEVHKGEFVLVIGPFVQDTSASTFEAQAQALLEEGVPPSKAAKQLAKQFEMPKSKAYQALEQVKQRLEKQ